MFLLEEQSAKAFLQNGVIQKLVPVEADISIRYIVFEGKQDLEKGIPRKLRAWLNPKAVFVVVRDQDSEPDCIRLKQRLVSLCQQGGRPDALVRIVCRELESWYLGDLKAVEQGFGLSGLAKKQTKYSHPDRLNNAKQQLNHITNNQYQAMSGSRAISPYINIEHNQSQSFQVFINGVRRIINPG